MARSSVQASMATAHQQISRCSHLMVRRRYECVFQRVPTGQRAHLMLLCAAHTAVQVPHLHSRAPSSGWMSTDSRSASSAAADSAP